MAIPVAIVLSAVSAVMKGSISKLVGSYVTDQADRRKIEAEIENSLVNQLGKSLDAQKEIVLAEVKSEFWLTRCWRPLLMCVLIGFLVFVGLILPLTEIAIGRAIPFNPRWQALPEGFWDFLTIGVGGYIGGRSLEKIFRPAQFPQLAARQKVSK